MKWNDADCSCKSGLKLVEVITAGFYKIFFLFLRSLVSFHLQCWRVGPTASPWWWRCLCAWLGMIFIRASSMFPPNSRTVQAFVWSVVSLLSGLIRCPLTAHRDALMITSMATVKAVGETAMIPHFAVVCCCCTQLLVLETDLEEATGLSFGLPVRGKKKKRQFENVTSG